MNCKMNIDRDKLQKLRAEKPFISLTDIIHELILQDIISFRIKPGERVSESSIAELLGVSRSPVKAALERLEEGGFITTQNSRYYVSKFDAKEYLDIYEATLMIEPYAAGLAAECVSKKELERMRGIASRIHELYREALVGGEQFGFSQLLEQEMEFHYSVVKASGNKLLIEMYTNVKAKLWRYRGYLLYSRPEGFYDSVDTDHALICRILKLGDRELAEAVMRRHLNVSRDGIARFRLLEHHN